MPGPMSMAGESTCRRTTRESSTRMRRPPTWRSPWTRIVSPLPRAAPAGAAPLATISAPARTTATAAPVPKPRRELETNHADMGHPLSGPPGARVEPPHDAEPEDRRDREHELHEPV